MEAPQPVVVPTKDAPHGQQFAYTERVSHTPTFSDCARAWLEEREAEHESGELAYHTILSYRRTCRVATEALGSVPITEIQRHHLRQMHATNRYRPTVANQCLDVVRRILRDAEEQGLRPRGSTPALGIRHHPELASSRPAAPRDVLRVFLTCAEIRAGRRPICHPNAAAIFQLVALTGARPSEIRDLEWPWVDLESNPALIRLPRHKTARRIGEKIIVLCALARGVLLSLNPHRPQHPRWVFPSHVNPGNPYNDLGKPWRRVALASGVGRTNMRDLRSGAATNSYDRGVPIELVQQMLGHSAVSTTLRYVKIRPHQVADAYATLMRTIFASNPRRR